MNYSFKITSTLVYICLLILPFNGVPYFTFYLNGKKYTIKSQIKGFLDGIKK